MASISWNSSVPKNLSLAKNLSVPPGGIASKPACDKKKTLKYVLFYLKGHNKLFRDFYLWIQPKNSSSSDVD